MSPPKKALIISLCWAHVCWDIRYSPICLPKLFPWRVLLFWGYPAFSTHHHLHPEKAGESHSILTKTFQTLSLEPGILNEPQASSLLWFVVTKLTIWNNLHIRFGIIYTALHRLVKTVSWSLIRKPKISKMQKPPTLRIKCQGSSCQISSAQRDLAVASKSVLQMPAPRWRDINHRSIFESKGRKTTQC